ncbi:transcription initiation factor TFIID subunit [Nesidiocoris tenuis]|uniref:Transcription initiation factor TFIID subunit n=1 Tax=Nesidiocoris tenuis TaxID=355587 RepID=A0ABN7B4R9_9HEMI|nr:transcription initiation factor TFIID subunit [Nesidiocoris tenuis]
MAVPDKNEADRSQGNQNSAAPPSSSAGQQLIDFLPLLEDYTASIPDAVTSAYLSSAGFTTTDPRILRLISIAGQKFISDITLDALQHCKVRTANLSSKSKTKERPFTFTMEDLTPALAERGIVARKPPYLY